MHPYIKKLQSKEEVVRKQILLGSLIVSMAVVGSIWVYSLTDRFGSQAVAQKNTEGSATKPFALFANSVVDTYNNITASVGNFSLSKNKKEQSKEKQVDLIVVDKQTVK